jgi:hypothetical protein
MSSAAELRERSFTAADIYDHPRETGSREVLALGGIEVSRTSVPSS